MDGVGEWATASIGHGRGADFEILDELHWPDSLGLLYSAFTYYTGFKVNSGEYKVMGLAPYGEPKYVDLIYKELMDLKEDGSFRLNQKYFDYLTGLTMTNDAFSTLFGAPPRQPESRSSRSARWIWRARCRSCARRSCCGWRAPRTSAPGSENLCLAGGVALNCVGNGRLLREGPFKQIWIQPAAGDAGGALGVAQLIHHRQLQAAAGRDARQRTRCKGSYLGPAFSPEQIETYLKSVGAELRTRRGSGALRAGRRLSGRREDHRLVRRPHGVRPAFARRAQHPRRSAQPEDAGRHEPEDQVPRELPALRALRAARACRPTTSSSTPTRPTCCWSRRCKKERCIPLTDEQHKLWGIDKLNVPRSDLPAITHIDYSARVQTVTKDVNGRYYELLKAFERQDRLRGARQHVVQRAR